LVLEAPERAPDGGGGYAAVWLARGVLWAEMRAGSGRAAAGEEAALGLAPWRITVRAAPEGSAARPRAGQRFREGGRVFDILAVTERDAGGRYLDCAAREEVVR
jgi:head-tail adaptor